MAKKSKIAPPPSKKKLCLWQPDRCVKVQPWICRNPDVRNLPLFPWPEVCIRESGGDFIGRAGPKAAHLLSLLHPITTWHMRNHFLWGLTNPFPMKSHETISYEVSRNHFLWGFTALPIWGIDQGISTYWDRCNKVKSQVEIWGTQTYSLDRS